jgi:MraZ protein
MAHFLGEFECRTDAKGRLIIPANLKKQLPQTAQESLVISRGFEKCLFLYTKQEWDLMTAEMNKLNTYVKKNREFVRYLIRGATELSIDASSRILLPKHLMEYAEIKTDVVLSANLNKIEIWSKKVYDELISNEPEDFASLAEEVMGKKEGGEHGA